MKFLIQWRNRNYGRGRSMSSTVTGRTEYATESLAQRQINLWSKVFPFNTYYLIPVKACP